LRGALRKYPPSKYYYQAWEKGKSNTDPAINADTLAAMNRTYKAANLTQQAFRNTSRLFGSGAYWGDVGGVVGGGLGAYMGSGRLGARAGRFLGNMAHPYLKRLTGLGSYSEGTDPSTVTNSIVHMAGAGPGVPAFGEDVSTVNISHREFIANVYAPDSAAFANIQFPINPGLYQTFPWLSQLAQNFDEYTAVQCAFTFRSMVADFASNSGQVGTVILATQYNNNEAPFTSARQMLNYDGAMSCKTSQTDIQGVECDPAKLSMGVGKYVRSGPVTANQDLNTLDSGIFNLAIEGVPSTYYGQKMGELWVSYTFQLRKPKEYQSLGLSIDQDIFVLPRTIFSLDGSDPTYQSRMTSALLSGQSNNVGCECVVGGLENPVVQITFPTRAEGTYEILLNIDCTQDVDIPEPFVNQLADTQGGSKVPAIADGAFAPPQINCWPSSTPMVPYTVAAPVRISPAFSGGVSGITDLIVPQLVQLYNPQAAGGQTGWVAADSGTGTWSSDIQAIPSVAQANSLGNSGGSIATQFVDSGNVRHTIGAIDGQSIYALTQLGTPSVSSYTLHVNNVDVAGVPNVVQLTLIGISSTAGLKLGFQCTVRQYNAIGNSSAGTPILVNAAGQVVPYTA